MSRAITPRWKKVEYSKNQIQKAGKIIRQNNDDKEKITEAIAIVDNWRAAHAFPLHVIYVHLRRMSACDNDIIVAERLKRLNSIIKKLQREPTMNLWTMQDIGGCRVIVSSVEEVYDFAEKYEKSRKRHIKKKEYDYIKEPKQSGYRSLHVVYQYHSDKVETYNRNILIEIQYRTHLQHLWATAVETMGLFMKQAIKSGQGSQDIKRFFVLISALFAIQENQNVPPGVGNDIVSIGLEIKELDEKHNYLDFLSGIRVAVDNTDNVGRKNNGYCILILNYTTRRLKIKHYKSSEIDVANDVYNKIESSKEHAKIDAVLVRVSSFAALQKAYPNYFSDIGEFVQIVKAYLQKL